MATISTRDEQFHDRQHELLTAHFRNAKRRDLTLVVLSCAIVATSATLVCFAMNFATAVASPLVMVAWGLFALTMILALVSFQVSQVSTYTQVRCAAAFYVRDHEDGGRGSRAVAIANDVLGWLSSSVFVAATVCLIVFVSINVGHQDDANSRMPTARVPSATVQAVALIEAEQEGP